MARQHASTTITIRMPNRLKNSVMDRADQDKTSASDWCRQQIEKALSGAESDDRIAAMEARIISRIDALEFDDADEAAA